MPDASKPRSSKRRYRAFRAEPPRKPASTERDGTPRPTIDPTNRRRYRRHYIAWLRPYMLPLALVMLLALLSTGLSFIQPILTKGVVDGAILAKGLSTAERIRRINLLGILMVAVVVAATALSAARGRIFNIVNHLSVMRLRAKLLDHLLHLSLGDLSEMKSGGLVSRLSGDVNQAMVLVQSAIIGPGTAAIQAVIALVIIFYWNWRLAVAVTCITVPLVVLHWFYIRRIRPMWKSVSEDINRLDGRAAETFGGIRVVRAFRREPRARAEDGVLHHTAMRKGLFATLLDLFVNSGWGLLGPGISLVIIWYGGYLVIHDQAAGLEHPTTVGDLFLFQGYVGFVLNPVMQIVNSISATQRALAATERVFDVLDRPRDKPDAPDAVDVVSVLRGTAPNRSIRELRFDRVTFAYRPDTPVVKDFSLTVPGGSVVALVGPSGAGKTTLTDLIARFHDPTSGAILLNGVDLRHITLNSYRRLLAVVQQETFLFDGSVRQNIDYGRRGATEAEIIDAARRANAWEFIEKLPEKLDTTVGERGVKLSGGQKQRLSIARAILADPQILILDEATSNLDTHSEQLIQSAMRDLFAHRTTFIIAHRLSTVTHADVIAVMDHGELVQVGRHEDLLAAGGLYAEMVERQRGAFEAEMGERAEA